MLSFLAKSGLLAVVAPILEMFLKSLGATFNANQAAKRADRDALERLGFWRNALAIPAGFEPATHGVEIRYSIQLSYGTVRAVTALGIRLVWPSLSSTANMKNPASRQGRRTDFLKFATKADGGPSCMVRPDTHACPPAVRRRGRWDRLDCQRHACDLFAGRIHRHQSVTFSRIF
jgi:hypothetical protein